MKNNENIEKTQESAVVHEDSKQTDDKVRAIRMSQSAFEQFKALVSEMGVKTQGAAFQQLLSCWSLNHASSEMQEQAANVVLVQTLTSQLCDLFTAQFAAMQGLERSAKNAVSLKTQELEQELAAATGLKLFFANDECILSKTEPLSTEVVDLLYYKFYKRILMIAEFDDYIIANTHMSRTSDYGLLEVDVVTNALAKYEGKDKPILFMGDLNTRPGFKVYNKLAPLMQCISPIRMADGEGTYYSETNSVGQYTWEWILDFIYMDYPSARSGEWSWTSHVVKDHITSDHAPVVADITCKRIKKLEKPRAWVDEEAHTAGLTGTWSDEVIYDWQTFTAALVRRD